MFEDGQLCNERSDTVDRIAPPPDCRPLLTHRRAKETAGDASRKALGMLSRYFVMKALS